MSEADEGSGIQAELAELTGQDRRRLVQQIHDSPTRLVLSVAGGSRALSDLQTAPGASRTLLEGLAPYTRGSVRALVSPLNAEVPTPSVSEEGVNTLAQACLARATIYATEYDEEFPVIGVSCTAALATQRERHGEDRAWMAIAAADTDAAVTKTQLVEFPVDAPGSGSAEHAETYYNLRMMQENQLADALLRFIAAHVAG